MQRIYRAGFILSFWVASCAAPNCGGKTCKTDADCDKGTVCDAESTPAKCRAPGGEASSQKEGDGDRTPPTVTGKPDRDLYLADNEVVYLVRADEPLKQTPALSVTRTVGNDTKEVAEFFKSGALVDGAYGFRSRVLTDKDSGTYRVTVRNVEDLAGNRADPDPVTKAFLVDGSVPEREREGLERALKEYHAKKATVKQITFNLDTNCTKETGIKDVRLGGQNWAWNLEASPRAIDEDGDGIYTIVFAPPPNSDVLYKWNINGKYEDLLTDGPAPCALATDGKTFANRLWQPDNPGPMNDTFGRCEPCPAKKK